MAFDIPNERPGDPSTQSRPEHRARELLHRVALLTICLQLPDVTDAEWQRWPGEIADANLRLDVLYADGLDRDFRGDADGCDGRRPQGRTA